MDDRRSRGVLRGFRCPDSQWIPRARCRHSSRVLGDNALLWVQPNVGGLALRRIAAMDSGLTRTTTGQADGQPRTGRAMADQVIPKGAAGEADRRGARGAVLGG